MPASKKDNRNGKLLYFYLNGDLHKSLHINRGADKIITWCYPLAKRVAYTYSDTKRFREPAFTTIEVCKMLMRSRRIVEQALIDGNISRPQHTYGLDEHRRMFQFLWSEENIMEAHAYFCTVHRGRPRKDGIIIPQRLPTARELRAMIRQEQILYAKTEDGFKPVWQAQDFD